MIYLDIMALQILAAPQVVVQNSFRCKDLFRTTKRGVHSEKFSDSKLFLED
jgi:hypothetical protein